MFWRSKALINHNLECCLRIKIREKLNFQGLLLLNHKSDQHTLLTPQVVNIIQRLKLKKTTTTTESKEFETWKISSEARITTQSKKMIRAYPLPSFTSLQLTNIKKKLPRDYLSKNNPTYCPANMALSNTLKTVSTREQSLIGAPRINKPHTPKKQLKHRRSRNYCSHRSLGRSTSGRV